MAVISGHGPLYICSARGMVRGYCGHLSSLLGALLGQLCLLVPYPPPLPSHSLIHGTRDIAGSVQKVSQNQPVQPVAINASVMPYSISSANLMWLL